MRRVTGGLWLATLIGLALVVASAIPATALVYDPNGGWQKIFMDIEVPSAYDGYLGGGTVDNPTDPPPMQTYNAPWTFTLTMPGMMKVTDLGDKGSYFRIWNNGVLFDTTPQVDFAMSSQQDPEMTYGNSSWSWAYYDLAPGSYSLNFQDALFSDGLDSFDNLPDYWEGASDAAFMVSVVPEPGTLILLGLGMAVSGLVLRRRVRS